MTRMCEKHEDVPYIVRSSGSVNGGSMGWGCAVCNMLEVERLRAETRRLQESRDNLAAKLAAMPDSELGWLVERTVVDGRRLYRTMDESGPGWTDDHNQAIRFARRADAEMFSAGDEDAWHIVEHMWPRLPAQPSEHRP